MTVKAGQKCTAIRRAIVPEPHGRRRRRGDQRAGWRRSPSATRRTSASGWARSPASASARRCARRSRRCATRPTSCTATRTASTSSAPTPSAARSSPPSCCAPAPARPSRTTSSRSARSARSCPTHSTDEAIELAARGQGSLVGSLVTHDPRSPARSSARPRARGTAGCWSSTATTPRESHRPRLPAARRSCTAAPAAPAAARSSAASAACCTTCSAPRSRAPPTCSPRSPAAGPPARERSDRRRAPVPQEPGRAAHRRHHRRRRTRTVTLDDIDHFAEFTGDTFYAHTDPEAAAANPLFGGIVAHGYLVVSLAAGLFVEPEPGPGAGQLRRRQPAVPHAGQGRRHDPGHADRQADHARAPPPTTARSAGTPVSPTRTASPVATLRRADPGREDMEPTTGRPPRPTRWIRPSACRSTSCARCSSNGCSGAVRHAYANVPHYRETFDAAGVHPDDCRSLPTSRSSPPPPRRTCATTTRSACSRCRGSRCGASTRRRGTTGRPTVVGYTGTTSTSGPR